MSKFYTGVGSRETPPETIDLMIRVARKLAAQGWTLRSGGAQGADKAFEEGWLSHVMSNGGTFGSMKYAELYIPWSGFEGHTSASHFGACIIHDDSSLIMQRAYMQAAAVHPAWERLKPGAKKLHGRNIFQVLGQDLDTPSKFLICWAPVDKHGVPKGGTRTAWVLAKQNGVECFNLNNAEHKERIEEWLFG